MSSTPPQETVAPPCLQIAVGSACQNRCRFCSDGSPRGVRPPEPTAVRRILEENQGLPEVLFTRFEPTYNRDLGRYARWAGALGYRKVSLITNGRRLGRPGEAARLVEAGVRSFVVSLHGSRPAVHDRLTDRPGSFADTVAGLEALARLREQVPLELRIVTTACAGNVDDLLDLYRLLRGFRPDGVGWNALLLQGRAASNAPELAIAYPRLVEALRRCLEAFPDAPPGLSNVPLCFALPRVPLGVLPLAEDTRMAELDAGGNLAEAAARPATRAHVFHTACADCAVRPSCLGLSAPYVSRFGWEGVVPLTPQALAEAAAPRRGDALGQPRPFVSADLLGRLLAPPDAQWEVLEVRVGPTEAFVRLQAHRPDPLRLRLVLTPRSPDQPAFRRTRYFDVALQGTGYSRREEAMAAAIATWIRRQERLLAPAGLS